METPQALTAFKAGQGDMVGLWDPFTFSAPGEGWVKISSGPIIGEFAPVVIIASEKALKEKPREVALWLESYYDYTDIMGDDEAAVVELLIEMQKENGITSTVEDATKLVQMKSLVTRDFISEQFTGKVGERDADIIVDKLLNFFITQGIIEEDQRAIIAEQGFVHPDVLMSIED